MPEPKAAADAQALDRINPDDPQSLSDWARKLDATPEQLKEALAAVGERAADVEMHLKGSRSTTNAELTKKAGGTP
jgi:hypothetical protein